MNKSVITLTALAGLALLTGSPAQAHDVELRIDKHSRSGGVHAPYGRRVGPDHRHYDFDRRGWQKYSKQRQKHWRRLVRAHDRWHRHNDHRWDRFYDRDHRRLHRQLGLSPREFHYVARRRW